MAHTPLALGNLRQEGCPKLGSTLDYTERLNLKCKAKPCSTGARIWQVEAGGSGGQGQPWLLTELEVSLDYVRACLFLKNKKEEEWKKGGGVEV